MTSAEDVLKQLELILDADPLIDEVGFVHPSQFPQLINEADKLLKDGIDSCNSGLNFWTQDHKLAVSTAILLPLYKAAKNAFMEAHRGCKMLIASSQEIGNSQDLDDNVSASLSPIEVEAMKHSRALLLLSADFGTAWNLRKAITAKMQRFQLFLDELHLSSLVLSYSPKSERAWSHRKWVITKIAGKFSNLEEVIRRESELVQKLAEKSKMNYRAWNHRCWVVNYMSKDQMLHELNHSQQWAGLHVADNSCFHYRARLLLKILEVSSHRSDAWVSSNMKLNELWEKELDWVEQLIRRYVGREALWLHRRFLSYCWIKHFIRKLQGESCDTLNVDTFMDNELQICRLHSIVPDDDFGDYEAQATFSATYIIWLSRQVARGLGIDTQKKLEANGIKILLDTVCPQKSILWDTLDHDHKVAGGVLNLIG